MLADESVLLSLAEADSPWLDVEFSVPLPWFALSPEWEPEELELDSLLPSWPVPDSSPVPELPVTDREI